MSVKTFGRNLRRNFVPRFSSVRPGALFTTGQRPVWSRFVLKEIMCSEFFGFEPPSSRKFGLAIDHRKAFFILAFRRLTTISKNSASFAHCLSVAGQNTDHRQRCCNPSLPG